MKLAEKYELNVLEEFGFTPITEEDLRWDESDTLSLFKYKYEIGHSRRGQFYFILIDDSKTFQIWASKPDGSGTFIGLPDVLYKLVCDDLIEI